MNVSYGSITDVGCTAVGLKEKKERRIGDRINTIIN
jgi:hypothetical protein